MHQLLYEWHVTFSLGDESLTLNETHPEFKEIRDIEGIVVESVTLIDRQKFSLMDTESQQMESIVHFVQFSKKPRLVRQFRRTEQELLRGNTRVVPALEFLIDGQTKYLFAFHDKYIITEDLKYHREEWPDAD
jgi:hypothetical protein